MTRVLILGAGGAAGINFCRSLRQAERFEIVATDVSPSKVRLPDADYREVLPPAYCRETRYPAMVDLLVKYKPDVIYAQADKEVAFLSQHRSGQAAFGVRTLLPSTDALGIASDKLALNKCLAAHGVAVPLSVGWLDDFDPRIWDAPRVWVRARCGAGSKASLPVSTDEQAKAWIQYWSEFRKLAPEEFMICEYLPGKEYAWQGVYRDGHLFASVTRTRDEYVFAEQMPSGQSSTPSVATIVHSDEVNALAEAAVAAIDPVPNGVYGVDCKTGADGVVKVTEINVGRFYTTSYFYAAAGCNLVEDWVDLAMGRYPSVTETLRDSIPAGTKWIRSLDREPLLLKATPIALTRADQNAGHLLETA